MRIHGITLEALEGKPLFAEIADELLAFLGEGPLVAHNAPFDFGFLNAEFSRLGLPALDGARMVDTLALAKTRFPGLPNSLDALCRRFGIDLTERTTHNALLDCRLLAEVYVELTGGRQRGLVLVETGETATAGDGVRGQRRTHAPPDRADGGGTGGAHGVPRQAQGPDLACRVRPGLCPGPARGLVPLTPSTFFGRVAAHNPKLPVFDGCCAAKKGTGSKGLGPLVGPGRSPGGAGAKPRLA